MSELCAVCWCHFRGFMNIQANKTESLASLAAPRDLLLSLDPILTKPAKYTITIYMQIQSASTILLYCFVKISVHTATPKTIGRERVKGNRANSI